MSHHALAKLQNFIRVALSTGDVSDSQVTGVHEPNELRRLMIQQCVTADWIGRSLPSFRVSWPDVRLLNVTRHSVATMTIGAPDLDRVDRVHVPNIGMARNATVAFKLSIASGLTNQIG
jgi:hypothetical protein